MALDITVNGVSRAAYTRYRTLTIRKDGAMETARVEFLDRDISASAFRPFQDTLRIAQHDGLEFGGEITVSDDLTLTGRKDGATVTVVEARGWYFEAEEVIVTVDIPAQGAYVTAEWLRATFLDAKGWTNTGPTTGGPSLPALSYVRKTVRAILDDLQERCLELEQPVAWRVNGDKEFAIGEVGVLTYGATLGDSAPSLVLPGVRVRRSSVRKASRLFVAVPGTGTVDHHETHAAEGATTIPINVLPNRQPGRAAFAAAAGAASIVVTGLRALSTIHQGATFTVRGQADPYTVTAPVTTDAAGGATVAFTPVLAVDVEENDAVEFDETTFVRLEVDGTPTPLDGSPWSYDRAAAAFVTSGSAPTTITYRVPTTYPATLQVWDDNVRASDGSWDYAAIKDAAVQAPEGTSLPDAKVFGLKELAKRAATPRQVTLRTFAQGLYPWLKVALSFPARNVSGDYLVQSTVLTDVGRRNQRPLIEATLLEGLILGRTWVDALRGRQGVVGGGSVTVGTVTPSAPSGGGGGRGWFYLGGNRRDADNSDDWIEIRDAVPVRLGGPSLAGTWTLRIWRSVTDSGTQVAVRLRDRTNDVTLASIAAGNPTTPTVATATFSMPATEGICMVEYQITAGSGSAIIENCSLEGY